MNSNSYQIKLNKTHYLFTAITLICVLALLNAIDYAVFNARFLPLPKITKLALIRYAPMFGVALSFFLWDKSIERPNKLYLALLIIFILKITVVRYLLPLVFTKFIYTEAYIDYYDSLEVLSFKEIALQIALNFLMIVCEILFIVFTVMILKRNKSLAKTVRFIFISFIIYISCFIISDIYSMDVYQIVFFNSPDTIAEVYREQNWQYVSYLLTIPLKLARIIAILPTFVLISKYRGEESIWTWFKRGPYRKFKKIISPYNPNGVE